VTSSNWEERGNQMADAYRQEVTSKASEGDTSITDTAQRTFDNESYRVPEAKKPQQGTVGEDGVPDALERKGFSEEEIYNKSFNELMANEGGFQNIDSDPGNWTGGEVGVGKKKGTKYGISAASYPDLDIRRLTKAKAKEIYKKDYWDKMGVDEASPAVRRAMFDIAVHSGISGATKMLQEALGVTPDGVIGEVTKEALENSDPQQLVRRLLDVRLQNLQGMSNWDEFGEGWNSRINNEREALQQW